MKSGRCNAGLELVWGGTRACMWANLVCHTFRWEEQKLRKSRLRSERCGESGSSPSMKRTSIIVTVEPRPSRASCLLVSPACDDGVNFTCNHGQQLRPGRWRLRQPSEETPAGYRLWFFTRSMDVESKATLQGGPSL